MTKNHQNIFVIKITNITMLPLELIELIVSYLPCKDQLNTYINLGVDSFLLPSFYRYLDICRNQRQQIGYKYYLYEGSLYEWSRKGIRFIQNNVLKYQRVGMNLYILDYDLKLYQNGIIINSQCVDFLVHRGQLKTLIEGDIGILGVPYTLSNRIVYLPYPVNDYGVGIDNYYYHKGTYYHTYPSGQIRISDDDNLYGELQDGYRLKNGVLYRGNMTLTTTAENIYHDDQKYFILFKNGVIGYFRPEGWVTYSEFSIKDLQKEL